MVVPVLLGMYRGLAAGRRRGPAVLLGLVLAYDLLYFLMLHYLRHRWV